MRDDDYLQVRVERHEGRPVLKASGELDATNCGVLAAEAARVHRVPGEPVQIDLSGLSFIDCAGLSTWCA